jgi:hypothetical protein
MRPLRMREYLTTTPWWDVALTIAVGVCVGILFFMLALAVMESLQ